MAMMEKGLEASPKKKTKVETEKRLATWRHTASSAVRDRIERAQTQRMFLISRKDVSSTKQHFVVLGSVGNVYDVFICHQPECSCPDFDNGNLCKHILFIFLKVLKVPAHSQLIYQKALLTSELEEIFENSPADPSKSVVANAQVVKRYKEATKSGSKEEIIDLTQDADEEPEIKQRAIEGDCPICYEEMRANESIVWCKTSCGNNMHAQCFNEWSNSSKSKGTPVTCVYCRAPWNPVVVSSKSKSKPTSVAHREGFLNLGKYQPNLPAERDTSTYKEPWWERYDRYHRYDQDDEEGDEDDEDNEESSESHNESDDSQSE